MTNEQPDHYNVLGVRPNAGPAEIAHAYRAQLRLHHPDTRMSVSDAPAVHADATLQRILAAYSVLRDPVSRADYDRERNRHRRPLPVRLIESEPAFEEPPIVAGPVYWQPAERSR